MKKIIFNFFTTYLFYFLLLLQLFVIIFFFDIWPTVSALEVVAELEDFSNHTPVESNSDFDVRCCSVKSQITEIVESEKKEEDTTSPEEVIIIFASILLLIKVFKFLGMLG